MLSEFTNSVLYEMNYGLVALILIGLFTLLYFGISLSLYSFFAWTLKKGWTEKVSNFKLFEGQIRFEILHSISSIVIFGLYGLLIVFCFRNGVVNIIFENSYMIFVDLLVLIIWNEAHFYFAHKLMHTKPLMGIHRTHHKSVVVTPFSTYSFHPAESLLFGTVMILPMLVYDFELLALVVFPVYHLFFNTLGHSNVKLKKHSNGLKEVEISTQHNDHHTTHNANFGFVSPLMDVLMRTHTKSKTN